MEKLKKAPFYIKVILLTILLTVIGGGAVMAVGVTRTTSGTVSKFDAAEVAHPQDQREPICTGSDTFTDIPGLTKNFQTGGLFTSPSPAIVAFQAQFAMPVEAETNLGSIRLVVDGVPQGGSAAELSINTNTGPATPGWSWNFFTEALASGNHTATLQWKTDHLYHPNNEFCVQNRSMFIWHN